MGIRFAEILEFFNKRVDFPMTAKLTSRGMLAVRLALRGTTEIEVDFGTACELVDEGGTVTVTVV